MVRARKKKVTHSPPPTHKHTNTHTYMLSNRPCFDPSYWLYISLDTKCHPFNISHPYTFLFPYTIIPSQSRVFESCLISTLQMFLVGGESSTRKRGRPPIVLTPEVIEQRRLSRKRINASRSKSEYNLCLSIQIQYCIMYLMWVVRAALMNWCLKPGEGPSKKRGRPKSIVQDRQSHRTVGSSPDSGEPIKQTCWVHSSCHSMLFS